MTTREFESRVNSFLSEALKRTRDYPELAGLHGVLGEVRSRLSQPMRVAIVGMIKAGKSTMMNALLGEALVATGTVEATFNVNWLLWGPEPRLTLRYKDGGEESRDFSDLTQLTVRAEEHRELLLGIEYVRIEYPNEILRVLNLIDTPGLGSFYKDDEANTRAFLSLYGEMLEETSRREQGNADAVLYLYSRGAVHSVDQETIEDFLRDSVGNLTPINSIAVSTKAEMHWPEEADPMGQADRMAAARRADPAMRRLFYTVVPTAGKMALGAQTLASEDLDALQRLASLPDEEYSRFLELARNIKLLKLEIPGVPVSGVKRRNLAEKLSPWGVMTACRLLREGTPVERLPGELLELSGIPRLRSLILSHFGNRAFLIKASTGFAHIRSACFHARGRHPTVVSEIVDWVDGERERLEDEEHAFLELKILRDYYEGRLRLSAREARDLEYVTGEHGRTLAERVGLHAEAGLEEVRRAANECVDYWVRRAANDVGHRGIGAEAANIISRAYERILHRLNTAEKHLALAREYLEI